MQSALKVGLALGSGAARGWAHIGVLKALEKTGIKADIVVGTSIGALVGAAYLSGRIAHLESWLADLNRLETARFFKLSTAFTGLVNKARLHDFLTEYVAPADLQIADLPAAFGSVATHLHSGREVWNTQGNVLEAVWSSISLPGLFPAIKQNDRWLIDGGLVNPVPVSVCRALGADIVIAVNLNCDILDKHIHLPVAANHNENTGFADRITEFVSSYTGNFFNSDKNCDDAPNLFDAIAASVNITQDRITRSRMAGDPPEILLQPRLAKIGLLEFYRAGEAIAAGERAVQKALPDIRGSLGIPDNSDPGN
ncbi:MAG: patatin-like phospholipase family protein [Methylophaga sp.]|nr:patatin-like phospholipase family protein [Methylophaga sp.]